MQPSISRPTVPALKALGTGIGSGVAVVWGVAATSLGRLVVVTSFTCSAAGWAGAPCQKTSHELGASLDELGPVMASAIRWPEESNSRVRGGGQSDGRMV
jgi:hypothetical protein